MNDTHAGDDTDIRRYQLAGYGSRDFGAWYVEAMAAYALQDFATARNTGMAGTANGDFLGHHFTARAAAGMPVRLKKGWTLTPLARLEMRYFMQGGYTEAGVGPLSMSVEGESAALVHSAAGARFDKTYSLKRKNIRSSLQAHWRHEFANDSSVIDLAGDAFGMERARPVNTFHVAAGISVSESKAFALGAQIDMETAPGHRGLLGQLVAQWKF